MNENSARMFTVGYGGRLPQEFCEVLKLNGVRAIVDVRLRPERASMGAYVKARSAEKGIQKLLSEAGVVYHSLLELGNVFLEFEDWRDRYREYFEKVGDLLLPRLEQLERPFSLLCSERSSADCHRLLIADYLARRGWKVEHLE